MCFPKYYCMCTYPKQTRSYSSSLVLPKKSTKVYLVIRTPDCLVNNRKVIYNGGELGMVLATPQNLILGINMPSPNTCKADILSLDTKIPFSKIKKWLV